MLHFIICLMIGGQKMIKQKIAAVVMIVLTLPVVFLERDITSTVFMSFFSIPMFFSKKEWFC